MANLKDIALELGVSISTVSRVANGKECVDPQTRDRVLDALQRMKYQPNGAARSLKTQKTRAVGLIVPDITNSYFAKLIKGLESVVWKNQYVLLLCNSDEDADREQDHLELLRSQHIAGLVLTTVREEVDYISKYAEADIPIVFVDNLPLTDEKIDCVVIDNVQASYDLNKHLIKLGHQKIGIITGPFNETSGSETYEGWAKALTEQDIEVRREWIVKGDFKKDSGYDSMNLLLSREERPTAVFAANNQMAYGATRAILEQGLRIPDDIAIVTFDTGDDTGMMHPRFTAIIEPAEEIGRIAGEILFRKLDNPQLKVHERITLEAELQIGDSCSYIDNES
jgi:LacI family transcriptional regulator